MTQETISEPASVRVLPSNRTFSLNPGETILSAAIRQGVGLPYGCKDGACGSCRCRLVAGNTTMLPYSDQALSGQDLANGFILTCRARADGPVVLESRQVTAADACAVRKMPVRVLALRHLCEDVMQVDLQLPAQEVFQYRAGQYVEFLLQDGTRRAYSVALPPHEQARSPRLELHIRHYPGGRFSGHVFSEMKPREILRIEGPFGSFFLREDSEKPIVLLATGTGFAPLKAILEHMEHKRIARPVHFYWGARRPGDLYLHNWVLAQTAKMPALHYVPVLSGALTGDLWSGRTGYVHMAVLSDFDDLSRYEVYACGAPAMIASAREAFVQSRALPPDAFFSDAFTTAADKAT